MSFQRGCAGKHSCYRTIAPYAGIIQIRLEGSGPADPISAVCKNSTPDVQLLRFHCVLSNTDILYRILRILSRGILRDTQLFRYIVGTGVLDCPSVCIEIRDICPCKRGGRPYGYCRPPRPHLTRSVIPPPLRRAVRDPTEAARGRTCRGCPWLL